MKIFCVLLILFLFMLFSTPIIAAKIEISGVVLDAKSRQFLPGANVFIKDLDIGAATDQNGKFTFIFESDNEFVLVVSFMGYKTLEQKFSPLNTLTDLKFEMAEDVFRTEEIVVTGIASKREKSVAEVAVSTVAASELTETNNYQEISQLLAGKVAGVSIKPVSGNVGSGIRFIMRSGGGLNGNGQPVVFVDGIRIESGDNEPLWVGGQGISSLAYLNPEDIKKVEILKGPAGAASYGTNGSNGVVLITTKRGQYLPGKTKGVSIDYKLVTGYNSQSHRYTEDEFLSYKDANKIFRDGRILQHSLSISGGSGLMKYYLGLDRRAEDGILPNNSMNRRSIKANFDILPNPKFLMNVSTNYTLNDFTRPHNDNSGWGLLSGVLSTTEPYWLADSASIMNISNILKSNRFIGSVQAQYKPFKNFETSFTFGIDDADERNDQTYPANFVYVWYPSGARHILNQQSTQFTYNMDARYSFSIINGLNATSIIGSQLFDRKQKWIYFENKDYLTELIMPINAGATFVYASEHYSHVREAGIYADHQFSYLDQYYFSFMLRRDYASSIGNKAPSIFYPRASVAIRMDRYSFFPSLFNLMKIRAAYGESGVLPGLADGIPILWKASPPGGYGAGAVPASIGNENIEPERVKEFEIGFETEINNKYSVDFTYYRQMSGNSIIDFYNAPSTGKTATAVPFNVGKVAGWGIESLIRGRVLKSNNFQIDVSLTNNYQTNEVKDLGGAAPIFDPYYMNVFKVGLPKYAFYTQKVNGALFNEDGSYKGVDVEEEKSYLGTPIPEYTGSFSLNLRFFKNFKVFMLSDWATGHSIMNWTKQWAIYLGSAIGMGANNKRYQELEDLLGLHDWYDSIDPLSIASTKYKNIAHEFAKMDYHYYSNFIEDADFFKLREISLSYSLKDLLPKIYGSSIVSDFVLGISARNLWTTTKYSGADVEVNVDGARSISRGHDSTTLMQPRVYNLWLKISL